jgi:hypothetical protein
MTLRDWVHQAGGNERVGEMLGVSPATIRGWFYQRSTPLPLVMREIVRRSRGAVTFDQIVAETKGLKPLGYGG